MNKDFFCKPSRNWSKEIGNQARVCGVAKNLDMKMKYMQQCLIELQTPLRSSSWDVTIFQALFGQVSGAKRVEVTGFVLCLESLC